MPLSLEDMSSVLLCLQDSFDLALQGWQGHTIQEFLNFAGV